MIEFLNFPPQEAKDVRLATEGKRALRIRINDGLELMGYSSTSDQKRGEERRLQESLGYMGQTIGQVLVYSLKRGDEALANGLAATIIEDYRDNVVVDPGDYGQFPNGITQGVKDALQLREREMEAKQ